MYNYYIFTSTLRVGCYNLVEKNYAQARYHFERSNDGEHCAMMLIEYHVTMGYPGEVDLFIAQSVLQ